MISGSDQAAAVIEQIEIELLLEAVYRRYGYDFRQYAPGSIRRRLLHRMQSEHLESLSQLQHLVLHDANVMDRLLQDISIQVTSMFRDPDFFQAIRQNILPLLRQLPSIRIWHAGCSTGEEAYSMAIMLREEGLERKATIYATDINSRSLERARSGIFPIERMQLYTHNYLRSGGKFPFSEYYSITDGNVRFDPSLKGRIVFAHHNLATDHSFNDFHVIVCRNVLIYFNQPLQQRVLQLFRESLVEGGTLALGSKEAVLEQEVWEKFDNANRIYRLR
jgi:chemotaxis protein methyltransferase CheR